MNPTAVYSKSGKGVQEAAGKTSLLQRGDRVVLAAIDGRATLADVAQKVGKSFDAAFQNVISQLDKNGFIREVTAGAPAAAPAMKAAAPKPAARPPAAESGLGDLDFSSLGGGKAPSRPAAAPKPAAAPPPPAPQPAAAKEQQSALAKAREEAEAKAAADRERLKKEAEAKARTEMEAKLKADAEKKMKEEAEARAKADTEAKVKAAREAAVRAAAEAKAKAEAEANAKLEAERKAREEMERRLEAERRAREEAERKAREEAERARKEAEEKARREAEELRQRLEAERKAREEAERKAKEEAERARRELEEERKRLEAEREQARQEAEARRRQQQEEERKAAEERERRRAEQEAQHEAERASQAAAAEAAKAAKAQPAPKAQAKTDSFADSLLADLANFTNKEEDEAKAKEESERKAKAEAQRSAREAAERQAKEDAERRQRAEEEQRRNEEEARRAREEEERRAQEEERRKREAEEIRRKAEAATAAAMAKEGRKLAAAPAEDDIPISEDDLGMDEVKREQAALAKVKAKEEKKEKERAREEPRPAKVEAPGRPRRPVKWGKSLTLTLVLFLVIGIGVASFVPLDTAPYERAATEALGRPVKIGSANLWLFSGLPQVRFKDVRVGDARFGQAAASGMPVGLLGDKKEFSEIEVDRLTLPQDAIGDVLFATLRGDGFSVSRVVIDDLQLPGPATLPKSLRAELALDEKGTLRSATLRGPDGLVAKLAPKDGTIDFEVVAAGFTLPIAPQLTLSNFAMKGSATPRGMKIAEWGGALFQGGISGTASVRWGGGWTVEGVLTVRNINAGVFAPALLSAGNGEGTAKFSMSASDPASLPAASRIDGNFSISKGTLGSFDLARAIQSGGKQANGVTQFAEMNGQATYERGTVTLRNVTIGAGALNAGASADIAQNGALSGRIVADMKTASQMLRATILLGGTVKEPQVRN